MPESSDEPRNDDDQAATTPATDGPNEAPAGAGEDDALDGLDIEWMDLSIETVEERISPSETNVFDK